MRQVRFRSALIVTAVTEGKPGVMALIRKFTIWRVGWRWFAIALLMTPTICVVPAYLNMFFSVPNPTMTLVAALPAMLLIFAVRLVNPLEWVDWFNRRRLLEPIGNIPPAEAEEKYYAATATMDNVPMAA